MSDFQAYKEFVTALVQSQIDEWLVECTNEQRDLYLRLYPAGPSWDLLDTAYDQVRRTVIKNRRNKPEVSS